MSAEPGPRVQAFASLSALVTLIVVGALAVLCCSCGAWLFL